MFRSLKFAFFCASIFTTVSSFAQGASENSNTTASGSWMPMNQVCFYMGNSMHDCERTLQIINMMSTDKVVLKGSCKPATQADCDSVLEVKALVVQ